MDNPLRCIDIHADREVGQILAEQVVTAIGVARRNTMAEDGVIRLGVHLISSDGDIAYQVTVFKDGRTQLFFPEP